MTATIHQALTASRSKLVVLACVALLSLVGCKQDTQADVAAPVVDPGPEVTQSQSQEPAAAEPLIAAATNAMPEAKPSFLQQLRDSPFASADAAMRETYSDALIAYQIGDYGKVIEKLTTLTSTELMTTEQNQALQDLMEKAKAGAASAAATNAAPNKGGKSQP